MIFFLLPVLFICSDNNNNTTSSTKASLNWDAKLGVDDPKENFLMLAAFVNGELWFFSSVHFVIVRPRLWHVVLDGIGCGFVSK